MEQGGKRKLYEEGRHLVLVSTTPASSCLLPHNSSSAAFACSPEGITSRGVWKTWGAFSTRRRQGKVESACFGWDEAPKYRGTVSCGLAIKPSGILCTKMFAHHENFMTRSAGVLAYKRIICKDHTCTTFKLGLCIDVGKKVWSTEYNDQNKRFTRDAEAFAKAAVAILKANDDKLPQRHRCENKKDKKLAQASMQML